MLTNSLKPRYNQKHILTFVSKLIHPRIQCSHLIKYFHAEQEFWDLLVKVGSSHLLLPAIYAAMKRKKIDHYCPKDLTIYLKEISDLNNERNNKIKKQIELLDEIFKKNKIKHVFLKGAALILTEPYDTLRERMIGDIDILVQENDLNRAQRILLDFGFVELKDKNIRFIDDSMKIKSSKHLNRLNHKDYIASVELHRRVLNGNKNSILASNKIFKQRQITKNGFWVLSAEHLWQHTILNWQYNDRGFYYNFLSWRSVLDALYLEPQNLHKNLKYQPKAIQHFYSLLSLFFHNYPVSHQLCKLVYDKQFNFHYLQDLVVFFVRIKLFISKVLGRLHLFLISDIYRKRIYQNPFLFFKKFIKSWIPERD